MTAHKRRHTTQPFALCKLSYCQFGRYRYQHVYVILHPMCFYYFHMFVIAEHPQYFPYVFSELPVNYFPAILWHKYNTREQLNDWANQNNPNNKAYKAKSNNQGNQLNQNRTHQQRHNAARRYQKKSFAEWAPDYPEWDD